MITAIPPDHPAAPLSISLSFSLSLSNTHAHTYCSEPDMQMVKGNLRGLCTQQDAGKIRDEDERERDAGRARQQKGMKGANKGKKNNQFDEGKVEESNLSFYVKGI